MRRVRALESRSSTTHRNATLVVAPPPKPSHTVLSWKLHRRSLRSLGASSIKVAPKPVRRFAAATRRRRLRPSHTDLAWNNRYRSLRSRSRLFHARGDACRRPSQKRARFQHGTGLSPSPTMPVSSLRKPLTTARDKPVPYGLLFACVRPTRPGPPCRKRSCFLPPQPRPRGPHRPRPPPVPTPRCCP